MGCYHDSRNPFLDYDLVQSSAKIRHVDCATQINILKTQRHRDFEVGPDIVSTDYQHNTTHTDDDDGGTGDTNTTTAHTHALYTEHTTQHNTTHSTTTEGKNERRHVARNHRGQGEEPRPPR